MEFVRAWEYFVFVFVAVMGLLQLIAAINQVQGMLFIRNRPATVVLSVAAILFAFWWFFYRDNRVNDVMRRTGLEGAQQFTVFCWTTFTALILTLVLASCLDILVYRRGKKDPPQKRVEGAYEIRYMSWFAALKQALQRKKTGDAGTGNPD